MRGDGGAIRSRRWLAAGAAGLALVAVLVVSMSGLLSGPAPSPRPSLPSGATAPAPSDAAPSAPVVGPVLFVETLDAEASRLVLRVLDGHTPPRIVASRPDVDAGPAWTVDPTATSAIVGVPSRDDRTALVGVDIASGKERWKTDLPGIVVPPTGAWSADGTRYAAVTEPDDLDRSRLVLLDAASGDLRTALVPAGTTIHGFASDGSLVLRSLPELPAKAADFRLFRVDPATLAIRAAVARPDAGPGGDGFAAIDPARGVALDIRTDPNRPGSSVRVWDLDSGASRDLLNAPSLDELVLDPTGSGVAVVAGTNVRYVRFDGETSTILEAASPVADVTWSADGSYVVVTTDIPDAGLTIVERASGRTVRIPQSSTDGELHLVAMAGGIPLPENPLAPEPSPSPSGGTSGPDVAGFPGLLEGWTDVSTGRVLVHVERRVPTEDGSLRTVSAMAPIDVAPAPGPEEGDDTTVELIPRPGSSDTLVWITTGEGSAAWLWNGVDPPTELALPADWPATAGDPAWRPDGGALAATAAHPAGDGFEPDFVVAGIGARRTTILPVRDGYDRLEGWWSKAELRVGHGVCFGGCGGEYAESARLRVSDGRLVQLGPSARTRAAVDELLFDGGQLVLSTIHDTSADDLVIDWPAELDGVRLIGAVADARALVLARPSGSSTELYVVDDVVGRARNGRLADPRPRLLATLRGRDDEVVLAPDRTWAIVTDRIGAVSLVRIDDGRAWTLDPGRALEWALP